jgi:predicted flap endonuclease-1-like 5' DNA nuclease
MLETIASFWHVIIILLAFVIVGWLLWPQPIGPSASEAPKIEPSAPKAVVDLAREMPKATEPVALVGGAPVAKTEPKAGAKPKAVPAPKPKAAATKPAAVAKPKAAPAKSAAAPKAEPAPVAKKPALVAKAATAKTTKTAAAPKPQTAAKAAPAPKAAAPKAKPAPKPKAVAAKAPAKPVIPDNLELLKGVGPKLNTLLKSLGVSSFEQVANWTAPDIDEIDAKLGTFAGRIRRDNWVDQAKLLVAGDIKGFEKKYGALGSEITG